MPINHLTTSVEYRDVVGESGYRIGSDGSVWSLWIPGSRPSRTGIGWRLLKPRKSDRFGHLKVRLRLRKNCFVHHLVLEAFVGPCPSGMECRHLDGNPMNNCPDNLRWGTRLENMQDMVRHGTSVSFRGTDHPLAKLDDAQVLEIRRMAAAHHPSQRLIGKMFGVDQRTVSAIFLRKLWPHL